MMREQSGSGALMLSAGTTIGSDVVNRQNEMLGAISDILFDIDHGRIAYAVMVFGGFMGIAERMYVVPWKALTLDRPRRCFVLDADKTKFSQGPGFAKDHWPGEPDLAWYEQVHAYYHTRPYWE